MVYNRTIVRIHGSYRISCQRRKMYFERGMLRFDIKKNNNRRNPDNIYDALVNDNMVTCIEIQIDNNNNENRARINGRFDKTQRRTSSL